MKTYLEISITAQPHQQENLIPTMTELGCEGFQETDSSLLCYIEKHHWNEKKYGILKNKLKTILHTISANAQVSFKEIIEENWNERWERSLQPIEIGTKIVIKPSWSEYKKDGEKIIITIDPKMSFGTGYHETTRLTLQLLEKYITSGCSVLDVGTGTGILAIASVKLGANKAVGIDIDEWSIENARENALANLVQEKVSISGQSLSHLSQTSFDIITANLTLNTIVELLPEFRNHLRPDGILLLSGLLQSDRETMINHLHMHSFKTLEHRTENEWIAFAAKKN